VYLIAAVLIMIAIILFAGHFNVTAH